MTRLWAKLATLAMMTLAFAHARAVVQQAQTPSSQDQNQSQRPQTQPSQDQNQPQQAEKPPHVDKEPNPDDRALEKTIMGDLQKDPHMAYARVSVHVTDTEVVLHGVVLTQTAKNQAAKIAGDHAGGRKVRNMIKVNTNPGSGI